MKIKWRNVIKLLVLIGCIGLIVHDTYNIVIGYGWTYFGFVTFILAWIVGANIINDIGEQLQN